MIEQRWKSILASASAVRPVPGRWVVVAPHPDDDVLSVGGLIATLSRAGADVVVVSVTYGGSAYPGLEDHDDLAATRRLEQMASLHQLGVAADDVVALGLRDGSVEEHESTVAATLTSLCGPDTVLVAPWTRDVHPDHEAVGRAAVSAAAATGCRVWFSLFWSWHHNDPTALHGARLVRVELDEAIRAVKEQALQCHRSQLRPVRGEPILPEHFLEPARWTSEYFVVSDPRLG